MFRCCFKLALLSLALYVHLYTEWNFTTYSVINTLHVYMKPCSNATPISTNWLNNYQHVSSWLTVNDTPVGHATQNDT